MTIQPVSSALASWAMELGKRLRAAREAQGLSHEQLVVKTQGRVGRQSIINIELHGQLPKADTLRALAEALNVSSDYLLCLDDHPTPWDGRERRRGDRRSPARAAFRPLRRTPPQARGRTPDPCRERPQEPCLPGLPRRYPPPSLVPDVPPHSHGRAPPDQPGSG